MLQVLMAKHHTDQKIIFSLPMPDFNISIVFIPLAANTIALGAVDTGSINAKLDR